MEPDRKKLESDLARRLGQQNSAELQRLLKDLGDPPRMENLPFDYFDRMSEDLRGQIQPVLEDAYREQARSLMDAPGGVGIDWNIINERASQWAREYSFELVKGVTDNTRAAIAQQVEGFYRDQRTMGDLEASLAKLFGPVRAEMIAITEVTRASVQGELAYARELQSLGLEVVHIWRTSNDDIMCAFCGPLNGKKQGKDWNDPPPAHPRCRCWISTEVVGRGR